METSTNKTTWIIDPMHSEIHFKVKHLVIATVTGSFDRFEGRVISDGDDFTGAVAEFSAEVNSINTNQPDRDNHLKSADFFDAANHPKLTFQSTGLEKGGRLGLIMTGDLTIRGITRKVELDVEFGGVAVDPYGNTKAGFELSGKINRREFGLQWNALTEAGGMVVADEVKLQMNVELAKQS
jgi:polyisoprenoid-binding protein YceI